jgi:putative peptidoglycan binding protein
MRILVILVCSLALACGAYAQPEQGKPQKKKQGQSAQHGPPPTGHPTGAGTYGKKTAVAPYQVKGNKVQTPMGPYQGHMGNKSQTSVEGYGQHKGKTAEVGKVKGAGKLTEAETHEEAMEHGRPKQSGVVHHGGAMYSKHGATPQHFNVPKQPNLAKAPAVQFQQGRHIEGSEHWQGQHYTAFRNYHAEWHDQGWWHNHYHNNIVFVFGAPYFFDAGWWRPAWGYYPNAYYAWDGPIYAYNHLPPDQVIANVQAALQEQGYYHGEVDGSIGPLTRAAIADYQRDHGLYETAAIDEPTLESLGMS